jgi:nitrogenase molybdenum-iron protein alpha chain
MTYTDEKVAPKREDRHGTCTAFGGELCGLKKSFGGGCSMVDNERAFRQGSICQMLPAAAIIATLPDTVVLMHGAVGCGGCNHTFMASTRGRQMQTTANPPGVLWVSTALGETDVVNGGEEKLRGAILEADERYRPRAIFVISTCTPSVIGDDVDGVIDAVRDAVSAEIVPVHCEGFKTKVMATAYDSVYHGIVRTLMDPPEVPEYSSVDSELEREAERLRRSRLVNLLNVSSMGDDDEAELSRLLRSLGLDVNIYPCFAEPENLRYATEAALSVSSCPTHDDYFVTFLEEKFGVPYVLRHMPLGIANTSDWIRGVAEALGKEEVAEKLIARETAELEEALAPLRAKLAGKTAVISAGEVRSLSIGTLLHELGMRTLAVRPYHYDQFGAPAAERLIEVEPTLMVNVATMQPYEAVNIVQRTRPDIYIGHNADNVWAAKHGIPCLPVYGGPNTYMGYAGVFDIARRLARKLANPSFNRRLGENVRSPFSESWFESDPFSLVADLECADV